MQGFYKSYINAICSRSRVVPEMIQFQSRGCSRIIQCYTASFSKPTLSTKYRSAGLPDHNRLLKVFQLLEQFHLLYGRSWFDREDTTWGMWMNYAENRPCIQLSWHILLDTSSLMNVIVLFTVFPRYFVDCFPVCIIAYVLSESIDLFTLLELWKWQNMEEWERSRMGRGNRGRGGSKQTASSATNVRCCRITHDGWRCMNAGVEVTCMQRKLEPQYLQRAVIKLSVELEVVERLSTALDGTFITGRE